MTCMKGSLFNRLVKGDIVMYRENHHNPSLRGKIAIYDGDFFGSYAKFNLPEGGFLNSPPDCLQPFIIRAGRLIK